MNHTTAFVATSPDGQEYEGIGLAGFCYEMDIPYQPAYKVLNSDKKATPDGWEFDRPGMDQDVSNWRVYRKPRKTSKKSKPEKVNPNDHSLDELMERAPEIAEAILELEATDPRRCIKDLLTLIARVGLGVTDGKEPPVGWSPATLLKIAQEMARAHGIDWSKAADMRTPEQIAADAVADLIKMGPSELLCQTDEMLDAMEAQLDNVDRLGGLVYDRLNNMSASQVLETDAMPDGQNPDEPPGPKAVAAAAHRWKRRIRRVRELARRAREKCDPEAVGRERRIQESTHLLRYMLYVNRSERPNLESPAEKLFEFGEIHVRAVMGLYFSRNGYGLTKFGLLAPGDKFGNPGRERVFEGMHYSGTGIMLPPRHGKTVIIRGDMALAINLDPEVQMAVVHDTEDMASKILVAVKTCFDRETEQGRRNYRLFPYELDATDNNNYSIRVKTKNRPQNPNLIACGIWTSGLGNNLHRLYGDDIVPASDVYEAARRTRRIRQFHTVWGSRDQGSCAYATLTGYPHHHQDLMWKTWEGAKLSAKTNGRQGLKWWFVRIPVGGPKDKPGIPKFRSIFSVYSSKWLRDKYRSYSDRSVWAANYELDPLPEGSKIVERVLLYDSESPDTQRMLNASEHLLSIDPTSTKNPKTSDMVGVTIGALGEVVSLREDEFGHEHETRKRMLYLTHSDEFHATQPEIIDHMMAIGQSRPLNREINQAIIEVTGVGHSLVDFLESIHGINGVYEATASKNKAERFRAVAGMMDNSDPVNSPPCVALPGRRKRDENGEPIDGSLELMPGFEQIYNYIVNFTMESGFHSLDSFVHMIEFCRSYRGLTHRADSYSKQTKDSKLPPNTSMKKVNWEKNNRKQTNRRSYDRRVRALSHAGI